MRSEYKGDIAAIRDIEDCIRATKKYTKGAFSHSINHPIQGEDFPSKVLSEYYEVYPDLEISWDMKATDAYAWVWGDKRHIDVIFRYNYSNNKAWIIIKGDRSNVEHLKFGIPKFSELLNYVELNGHKGEELKTTCIRCKEVKQVRKYKGMVLCDKCYKEALSIENKGKTFADRIMGS